MTHKFAEALQIMFPFWNVNCEYNREGKAFDSKRIDLPDDPGKMVFPEIIIHQSTDPINMSIIEAKPSDATPTSIAFDKAPSIRLWRFRLSVWITAHLSCRPDTGHFVSMEFPRPYNRPPSAFRNLLLTLLVIAKE
jgi:hypothetical protein